MRKWTGRRVLAMAAVGVVAAGAGVAYAAIPSSSGTISGCYENRTGLLRVIDAEVGKTCTSWETAIEWNQRGPQGPPGIADTREVNATTDTVTNTYDGVDVMVASARCEPGEVATGGGYRLFGSTRQIELQAHITESLPAYQAHNTPPTAWTVSAYAPSNIGYWGIDARAICAKVGS